MLEQSITPLSAGPAKNTKASYGGPPIAAPVERVQPPLHLSITIANPWVHIVIVKVSGVPIDKYALPSRSIDVVVSLKQDGAASLGASLATLVCECPGRAASAADADTVLKAWLRARALNVTALA